MQLCNMLWKLALLLIFTGRCHCIAVKTAEDGPAKLQHVIKDDGSYSFLAGEHFALSSEGAFLQAEGKMATTKNGSLKLTGTKAISGSDSTGTFSGKIFQYIAGSSRMNAEVAVYNEGQFVRFTQSFPSGVKQCNVSDPSGLLSGFPSFNIGNSTATKSLGFLASFGDMFGYGYSISDVATHPEMIRGGEQSGPLVLFDQEGRVMILSSYKSFMAHNMMYENEVIDFGIMGGVTTIPVRYQIDTLLYYSDMGINRAIEEWGQILLTRYHKHREYLEADFSINYLGYYTDNGAYYYYNTEANKTYETTMLDVVAYAKSSMIPYGYLQYDSWWYYKSIEGGVKNWTSEPSIFPSGINSIFESTGLPVVAHNRYWAADTDYAKKNGGKYDFYVEEQKAIPDDKDFWNDLFRSSKPWGLITYEQDWLVTEFREMKITHTNISVAHDWLMQMGEGAATSDLTIQYCMALPRHMLQSVEIPVVTQARVSGDYHPGNTQWKIGVTSMFAHALYVAPYKDTFWTTSDQPGNPYGETAAEPNTELQAAISTLSTGPVGPSDGIGHADVDLLMKCCRADGLIIKPSRPITSTDETVMKHAFASSMPNAANPEAEVYSTYSDVRLYVEGGGGLMRFGILLAAGLTTMDYKVGINAMYVNDANPSGTKYVAYQGHPGVDTKLYNLSFTGELSVKPCGLKDFQLWHISPVIKVNSTTEAVILGERSKWVPVSSRRIRGVEIKNGNLLIDIMGKPTEVVTMDFVVNGQMQSRSCTLAADGTVRMSVNSGHCLPS